MGEDNDQRASNRLAVDTFMPMMVEACHDGLREAGSPSRWLLATLVAINGAAAITLLPLNSGSAAKLGGAGAFLAAMLAALGAGSWSPYAFKRATTSAGKMVSYWLKVANDGARLDALEATMERRFDQAIGSHGTHVMVSASVATFLVGGALVGWGPFLQGDMP